MFCHLLFDIYYKFYYCTIMDESTLISCGLSQNQARTYRALVMRKSLKPSQLAKLTGESRTNSYAILDRLVQLGLATKADEAKKFAYYPTSPLNLKILLDEKRNEAEKQLSLLDRKLPQMLSAYELGGSAPKIKHYIGKKELEQLYKNQASRPGKKVHFIRSLADVPYFGMEEMTNFRLMPVKFKKSRVGIVPFNYYGRFTPKDDAKSRLSRTWLPQNSYTAPIEWAVSGDTVDIMSFIGEGYAISIQNQEIANSLRQIIDLFSDNIRKSPDYEQTPKAVDFLSDKKL